MAGWQCRESQARDNCRRHATRQARQIPHEHMGGAVHIVHLFVLEDCATCHACNNCTCLYSGAHKRMHAHDMLASCTELWVGGDKDSMYKLTKDARKPYTYASTVWGEWRHQLGGGPLSRASGLLPPPPPRKELPGIASIRLLALSATTIARRSGHILRNPPQTIQPLLHANLPHCPHDGMRDPRPHWLRH